MYHLISGVVITVVNKEKKKDDEINYWEWLQGVWHSITPNTYKTLCTTGEYCVCFIIAQMYLDYRAFQSINPLITQYEMF